MSAVGAVAALVKKETTEFSQFYYTTCCMYKVTNNRYGIHDKNER